MSYASWEQVTAKYPSVAKITGSTLQVSIMSQVDAELNGLLSGSFTVPFSPVPPMISDLAADLVYIKLKILEPKQIAELQKYFKERIAGLNSGAITLVSADGTNLIGSGNVASLDKSYTSAFGHDNTVNWKPDADAIQDDKDSRDTGFTSGPYDY